MNTRCRDNLEESNFSLNFRSNNEWKGFALSTCIVGCTGVMLMRPKWIFYHQLASDRSEDVEEILRWLQWFVCPGFLCAVTCQISGTVIICQSRLSLALEHPEQFFLTGGHRINQISGFARTHCVYICLFWLLKIRIKKICFAWELSLWSQLLCAFVLQKHFAACPRGPLLCNAFCVHSQLKCKAAR